jgi:hypothetical protein
MHNYRLALMSVCTEWFQSEYIYSDEVAVLRVINKFNHLHTFSKIF